MSDARVQAAIEQMEAWLADPAWEPNPEVLAEWNAEFPTALAQAEKAAGWSELRARAHEAGRLMEVRADQAAAERDRLKRELEIQDRGSRALKGYGSSVR